MNFNTTEGALLRLIRQSLFECDSPITLSLSEQEWKALVAYGEALFVSAPLFQGALALDPAVLPKYLPEAWSELAFRRSERTEAILAEQAKLADHLRENRIPMLFLADTAAAAYYPSPSLRSLRGTECLCDRPIGDAADVLSLQFPLSVKLQLAVNREDALESARLRSMLARALDSIAEAPLGEHSLPVPSIAVQALLLLLKAEEKPSFLLLTDWAVFLRSALQSQEINLAMQARSWEQCGLLTAAKTLSLAASIAFSFQADEWFADADQAEAETLLARILTPDGERLARAQKNLEIAMQHATRPPKVTKVQKMKKKETEKNTLSRFLGGIFKKKS